MAEAVAADVYLVGEEGGWCGAYGGAGEENADCLCQGEGGQGYSLKRQEVVKGWEEVQKGKWEG